MTFFIILLVLTVLGLFSNISQLSEKIAKNHELQNWCIESLGADEHECYVSGILDTSTKIWFVIDLVGRLVAIFFYIWGIRAACSWTALHAASLYRFFWV